MYILASYPGPAKVLGIICKGLCIGPGYPLQEPVYEGLGTRPMFKYCMCTCEMSYPVYQGRDAFALE